ncbi:MAG: 50S ribosomal protein L24 [Nitrospirae bacterium]|nr:50S ribosomal protein L24 [Nitrospirota bacterium]
MPKFKIRKGDTVMVMTGKDRGKTGKVLEVDRSKQRVFVEKLNIIKRHTKPSQKHRQGGIIEKEAPIQISNVMIVCRNCGKAVRIGMRRMEDGQKLRCCKKCGEIIDHG